MCSAYTLGIQGDLRTNGLAPDKALAMLKTFAGYSAPVNGINIGPCILGERELRTYYLPPVEAFYPGQQQGCAVADVLLGRVNPSGRLSLTVPQIAGHIPTVHDCKPSGRGYYHQPGAPEKLGRDYVFSSPDPLWAFGFGLSYTTFEYAALKVETPAIGTDAAAKVSFVVKNTGGRAGKEVAQVYIRDEVSSVTTPVMRLAGFVKIELPPGESQTVTVTIPPSELSLWNVAMKRVVEPGWFSVLVGASAADIRLRGRFEVVVSLAQGTSR